jgi:effector-binding domain-containing protein/uncharacterized protein YndB with AHSA1/START domain
MKTVKRILLFLAIFILAVSAVGLLFFPSHMEVRRSVTINASQEAVFDYVNELRNFNIWSPWHDMDTAAVYTFEGPASGAGAVMRWKSDSADVGQGSMTITESTPYASVKQDLEFMKNGVAKGEFRIAATDSGTVMTWVFSTEAGANPLLRILGSFMDGMIGPDFERGLGKLKSILEASPSLNVQQVDVPEMHYLYVKAQADESDISNVLGSGYGRIMDVMRKQGLVLADAPFAIYQTPPPVFEMEIGIPVVTPGKESGDVKTGTMGPCKALMVRYFGPYEKSSSAHAAIREYLDRKGMTAAGAPWETYVTDPATEPDTSKWETDVYYPVK